MNVARAGRVGIVVLATITAGCSLVDGSDAAASRSVERAVSAIAPREVGTVVVRTAGDEGGTFAFIPYRRTLVLADGPPQSVYARVEHQLDSAGFRESVPGAGLSSARPTIWRSHRFERPVHVYVWIYNPGDTALGKVVPPSKIGVAFDVSSGG